MTPLTPSDRADELKQPGPPSEPRPAASIILLRSGGRHDSKRLEVLLGRRTPHARFMADVWVFPGGAVDPLVSGGEPQERDYCETAVRELEEEVAVTLDGHDGLVPFSRWITPVEVKIRFDTRFYLAAAPAHCSPAADDEEIVEVSWFTPAEALERHLTGEVQLVFPTIKQLESLREHATVEQALSAARARKVEPILPKLTLVDGKPHILLPGDAGYEEAATEG